MKKLIAGIQKFNKNELKRYQDLFLKLSEHGQNPHTLFITCCDSRVLAELITQSQPGDLFVVKNVGNIVPPSTVTGSTNSTAAAIEFAVQTLNVHDIVVCGHSLCGAMSTLLNGLPDESSMPHLREWLELANPIKEIIETEYTHLTDCNSRTAIAAQKNVLFALENLKTYPFVKERVAAGALRLHGWFFEISTGKVLVYHPQSKQFQPIEH